MYAMDCHSSFNRHGVVFDYLSPEMYRQALSNNKDHNPSPMVQTLAVFATTNVAACRFSAKHVTEGTVLRKLLGNEMKCKIGTTQNATENDICYIEANSHRDTNRLMQTGLIILTGQRGKVLNRIMFSAKVSKAKKWK